MTTRFRRDSETNFMNINPRFQHPSKLMKRRETQGPNFGGDPHLLLTGRSRAFISLLRVVARSDH